MTPEQLQTEIAGLTEEIRELEQVNATLLASPIVVAWPHLAANGWKVVG